METTTKTVIYLKLKEVFKKTTEGSLVLELQQVVIMLSMRRKLSVY